MALHASALFALVATLAVAAASASAYARAADTGLVIRPGAGVVGDDAGDELRLQLQGGALGSRRRLDDLNATIPDANATSADSNATTTGYISYLVLSADRVPCTQRGASYYNCRPGAEANPYSRGCSAITQCRD